MIGSAKIWNILYEHNITGDILKNAIKKELECVAKDIWYCKEGTEVITFNKLEPIELRDAGIRDLFVRFEVEVYWSDKTTTEHVICLRFDPKENTIVAVWIEY